MKVALAIDVGFGVTKFTYRPDRSTSKVAFDSFPSVAVPTQRKPDVPEMVRGRRMTLVEHKGQTYSVGPDVCHDLANMHARQMTENFDSSDTYHALMRGALSYMNEEVIDVLVLGQPTDRFDYPVLIDSLKSKYTGKIDIDGQRSVLIKQVIIHPQPFGSYICLARYIKEINQAAKNYPLAGFPEIQSSKDLSNLSILIIDSGAYTLDWLFMTPGGHIRSASSAANNAGRHRIVRMLYDEIKSDLQKTPPLSMLPEIDLAERNKQSIYINGRLFDLQDERFQSFIRSTVNDNIYQMEEHIGANMHRVRLIAVVGGEPNHAASAIRSKIPNIPLFTLPVDGELTPIFTNLAGFQEYAEHMARVGA